MEKRILILLLLSSLSLFGQNRRVGFFKELESSGAVNNITVVHANGMDNGGSATGAITYNFGGFSFTSGQVIFLGVVASPGDGNAITFTTVQISKTTGTGSIGTVSLDQQQNPTTTIVGCALYRINVTGNGTLTLAWTAGNGHTYYLLTGDATCSGVAASPLGTGSVASGNSTTASTGSITTSTPGIIVYVGCEQSQNNWTRTFSDTLCYKDDAASTSITGIVQYKLQSSSPNTLTSSIEPGGVQWYVAYEQYKSN